MYPNFPSVFYQFTRACIIQQKIYPQEVTCCIHFALNPRVSGSDATCKVTQEYCCSWEDETDHKEDINIGYNARVQHFERLSCYIKPVILSFVLGPSWFGNYRTVQNNYSKQNVVPSSIRLKSNLLAICFMDILLHLKALCQVFRLWNVEWEMVEGRLMSSEIIMACSPLKINRHVASVFRNEDRGTVFLWNVRRLSTVYTTLQQRAQKSS